MTDPVYTPPKRRRRAKGTSVVLPALALAILVYVFDQAIKLLVENTMAVNESIPLFGGDFLSLTYILNDGGAFGIFSGSQAILMIGSAVAVVVVLWMLLAGPPSKLTTIGCGLILGGAAGNLHDRIASGEVTDYVHFSFWYIFNAADAAIVVGVAMLLISSLFPPKSR